jgi:hypothetical protein
VASRVRFGSVRFGSVRFGSVRFGSVRFGSVRFGSVRFGSYVCSRRFGSVTAVEPNQKYPRFPRHPDQNISQRRDGLFIQKLTSADSPLGEIFSQPRSLVCPVRVCVAAKPTCLARTDACEAGVERTALRTAALSGGCLKGTVACVNTCSVVCSNLDVAPHNRKILVNKHDKFRTRLFRQKYLRAEVLGSQHPL